MHQYHVSSEIRLRVFTLSSLLAILSAWILSRINQAYSLQIPWFIDTPSVLGFLGIYIGLYDLFLWRVWPFRSLRWFQIPNLNGNWRINLKSSHEGFESTQEAIALVRQSASRMTISIDFMNSCSHSISASFIRAERLSTFELIYHYISQPKPEAPPAMNIHHGTTHLRISEDTCHLQGEYFSGRGRQNFGSIDFTKQE